MRNSFLASHEFSKAAARSDSSFTTSSVSDSLSSVGSKLLSDESSSGFLFWLTGELMLTGELALTGKVTLVPARSFSRTMFVAENSHLLNGEERER